MPTNARTLLPILSLLLAHALDAQPPCANATLPGLGYAGVKGTVNATARFDPDGSGPLPETFVIGGEFDRVGRLAANNIAMWDPVNDEWAALGEGLTRGGAQARVNGIAVAPNGDLFAVGQFSHAGGLPASHVARWDGTAWSALGSGLSQDGLCILTMTNGDVFVGGYFTAAGGVAASRLARWDGSTWSAMASGQAAPVTSLAAMPNGDVLAGGRFGVSRWNGASWAPLGTGLSASFSSEVSSILPLPSGDVLVSGSFFFIAGQPSASHVVLWDGLAWSFVSNLPGPYDVEFRSMLALPGGDILFGGSFEQINGVDSGQVARWNGSSWSAVSGAPTGEVVNSLLAIPGGDVLAAGDFHTAGGGPASAVARWDGAAWAALDEGLDGEAVLTQAVELPNGNLVVAGLDLRGIGGVPVSSIAEWNGSSWSDMAGGLTGSLGQVRSMEVLPGGELVVTGYFDTAGGLPADRLAIWDGVSWSTPNPPLQTLGGPRVAVLPNGDFAVAGWINGTGGLTTSGVVGFDGSSWYAFGAGLPGTGPYTAITSATNGDLYVAGTFEAQPGQPSARHVARWDGSSWTVIGSPSLEVYALEAMANGDLVIGGNFSSVDGIAANRLARWNGTTWAPLGAGLDGTVWSLAQLPNGDLVAGGSLGLAGSGISSKLARWDGVSWTTVGTGADDNVFDVRVTERGNLIVAGEFGAVDGVASAGFAYLSSTCPASTAAAGQACPSSGGNNELVADTLPWLGATFRASCSDLPLSSLVAISADVAVGPGIALNALPLPQPAAGCQLFVAPQYLGLGIATNGNYELQWPLPNDPLLIGAQAFAQYVVFEVDAALNILETTSTNALQLTLGML